MNWWQRSVAFLREEWREIVHPTPLPNIAQLVYLLAREKQRLAREQQPLSEEQIAYYRAMQNTTPEQHYHFVTGMSIVKPYNWRVHFRGGAQGGSRD